MMDGTPLAFSGVKRSFKGQAWRARAYDARAAEAIAQSLGESELVGRILAARGVSAGDAEAYLTPRLDRDLPDPSIIRDMDTAAERVVAAIQAGEKIALFGDYDVDGATSAAILTRFLRAVGAQTVTYIPDRLKEGYGPNAPALLKLKADGAGLVIVVDSGTLAFEPLAEAARAGLDIIVVDHHKAETRLPDAIAVVNPNRLDDDSGLGMLAAAGVSFLLAVAVNRALRQAGHYKGLSEPDLTALLDLAALGTVCDVVPVVGVNRLIVSRGLEVMAGRANVGLRALAEVGGVSSRPTSYHAGFVMGPRINAGGRVGEAGLGAKLLSIDDEAQAYDIAIMLDAFNAERREIERAVEEQALAQALEATGVAGTQPPVVVVAGKGWHPGVVGIVAGRLKDRLHRPAIVLAADGGTLKGSARSIAGVDIGNAVLEAKHKGLIQEGGGHAMAAGLTLAADRLVELGEFLNETLAEPVAAANADRSLAIDGAITISGAGERLMSLIDRAGPYGPGNPTPRFAMLDVTLQYADVVGTDHVRVTLAGADGGRIKGISFRSAAESLGGGLLRSRGRKIHVAGKLKRDEWAGGGRLEIHIDDAAAADDFRAVAG